MLNSKSSVISIVLILPILTGLAYMGNAHLAADVLPGELEPYHEETRVKSPMLPFAIPVRTVDATEAEQVISNLKARPAPGPMAKAVVEVFVRDDPKVEPGEASKLVFEFESRSGSGWSLTSAEGNEGLIIRSDSSGINLDLPWVASTFQTGRSGERLPIFPGAAILDPKLVVGINDDAGLLVLGVAREGKRKTVYQIAVEMETGLIRQISTVLFTKDEQGETKRQFLTQHLASVDLKASTITPSENSKDSEALRKDIVELTLDPVPTVGAFSFPKLPGQQGVFK